MKFIQTLFISLIFFCACSLHAAEAPTVSESEIRAALGTTLQSKQNDPNNTLKVHLEDLDKLILKQINIFPLALTDQGFRMGSAQSNVTEVTTLVYLQNQPIGLFYATLKDGKWVADSFGNEPVAKQFGAILQQFPDENIRFFVFTGHPVYGFMMGGKGAAKPTLTLFTSVKDWDHIQPTSYNEGLADLDKVKNNGGEAVLPKTK